MQQLCLGDDKEPNMTLVKVLRPLVRGGHAEPDAGSRSLAFSVENERDAFLRTSSQISGAILELLYYIHVVFIYCICIRAACTTVLEFLERMKKQNVCPNCP